MAWNLFKKKEKSKSEKTKTYKFVERQSFGGSYSNYSLTVPITIAKNFDIVEDKFKVAKSGNGIYFEKVEYE